MFCGEQLCFLFICFLVYLFIYLHVLDLEYNFVRKERASKCLVPSIIVTRSAKPMESSRNNTMAQKQPSPGSDVREAGAPQAWSCESAAAAALFKM